MTDDSHNPPPMPEDELAPEWLRLAYSRGYFPMPDPESDEILWFHPDPRAIIPLDGLHVSRSLKRSLRRQRFTWSINRDFAGVIRACADRKETWIDDRFIAAYTRLHHEGEAHSLEVWQDDKLVGGLYGVSMGGAFFAESKFHRVTDASKAALYYLVQHMKQREMSLLEVQFITEHLRTLGAITIPRSDYLVQLFAALQQPVRFD